MAQQNRIGYYTFEIQGYHPVLQENDQMVKATLKNENGKTLFSNLLVRY